jgi:hypothetical protein
MNYLTEEIKLTLVQAALADGQTDPDSTAVDMAGFDGVMFVGIVGTITGAGTVTLKAQQSDDNGVADAFSDLSGVSAQATGADADSDKLLVLDIDQPSKRYVRTNLTRATANAIYGGTLAIQYKARVKPTATAAVQLAASIVQEHRPAEA